MPAPETSDVPVKRSVISSFKRLMSRPRMIWMAIFLVVIVLVVLVIMNARGTHIFWNPYARKIDATPK